MSEDKKENFMKEFMKLDYFAKAKCIKMSYDKFFISSIIITTIMSFLEINKIIEIISIFVLILSAILLRMIDYFQGKGEENRRKKFIDNSFGSKLHHLEEKGYYGNDDIENGLYKMIVNIFESTLFSKKISQRMREKSMIYNLLFSIFIIILAIYGFLSSKIALPVLQLFISQYLIMDFLIIKTYNDRVELIYNEIKALFELGLNNEKKNIKKHEGRIIKSLIDYEGNVSSSKLFLNSKYYNELRDELNLEWKTIRKRYDITEE